MNRNIAALLIGAVIEGLGTSTEVAAEPAQAPAAEAQPSPAAVALVKRLLAAIHIQSIMEQTLKNMLPMMQMQIAVEHPELATAGSDMIAESINEAKADYISKMIDREIPIYASVFTEKELSDMVTFYESPSGQTIIAKTPELAPRLAALAPELMPGFQADVDRRLQEKLKRQRPPATPPN